KELGRDKVFDVIGRLFEGVSIKAYLEKAVASEGEADAACRALEGTLTKEQVEALEARERRLYGDGGGGESALATERAEPHRAGEAGPGDLAAAHARVRPAVRREVGPAARARHRRRPRPGVRPVPPEARGARLPLEPAGDLPARPAAAAHRPEAPGPRQRPV